METSWSLSICKLLTFLHSISMSLEKVSACSLSKKALSGKPSKVSFAEKKDEIGF